MSMTYRGRRISANVSVVSASSRFGKFKPETEKPVRSSVHKNESFDRLEEIWVSFRDEMAKHIEQPYEIVIRLKKMEKFRERLSKAGHSCEDVEKLSVLLFESPQDDIDYLLTGYFLGLVA